MKTLIRNVNDYVKNIVFKDWQMHYLLTFIWEERRSFRFDTVILLNFLLKINRYGTTFDTLAEIKRDCKDQQLCMGYWLINILSCELLKYHWQYY